MTPQQLQLFGDGLVNVTAQLGTDRDKASATTYISVTLMPQQLLDAYRGSWLAGAIVDYPAEDSTRNWREWRAKKEQIEKIEALEKKLKLKLRTKQARVAARLYGGAAIYANTRASARGGDASRPMRIGEEIISLVTLTSNSLTPEGIVRDIDSEYYGRPEFYTLTGRSNGHQVRIHASRLGIFLGREIPDDPATTGFVRAGWADSSLQAPFDAVRQMDGTMANVASLIFEAKVDVLSFEGLAEMLEDESNDEILMRRLRTMAAMKGINGALLMDMKDKYEQKSASFNGLPDLISKFQEGVAGAAGIPVTRLFGRTAAGMSGGGEGDERVYYDRIKDEQESEIGPALELIDACLIKQALGSIPSEIHYAWRPLRQQTEGERAEIFVKTANAARTLAGASAGEIIPIDALSDAVVTELEEQGVLPGLVAAIEEYGSLHKQMLGEGGARDPAPTSNEETEEEQAAKTAAAPVNDAAPRALYVSRKVKNGAAILAHYRKQGVEGLIDSSDMHVTITYSSTPVEWMKMGSDYGWGELKVEEGGPRVMDVFGENGDTAVLSFHSSQLNWRHQDMRERGASWDHPEYQPHISISYKFSGDIAAIQPWTGEIILGPEIFEALDLEWKEKVNEK